MTEEKLCSCRKNVAGGSQQINFEYDGFNFSVFKPGGTCFKCEKASTLKIFKKYGQKLVKLEGGHQVKVNWHGYLRVYQGGGSWAPIYTHILVDIGILSLIGEGNWEMYANGIGMNPFSSGGIYLYFTREEDVVEYARLKGANTIFDWAVRKLNSIIVYRKYEVLRKQ